MRWLRLTPRNCCYCGRKIKFWDRCSVRVLRNRSRVPVHQGCGLRMQDELEALRVQRALHRLRERLLHEPEPDFGAMSEPEVRTYLASLGLRTDLVVHVGEAQSLLHLAKMQGRDDVPLNQLPAVARSAEHHFHLVETNTGG